jgi:tRNA 2-thiouridine synthesizing protein C
MATKKFLYVNRKAPDVSKIYVEQESLEMRGLGKDDLMPLVYEDEDDDWAEKDSIHVVSSSELADIIEQQDVILNF